MKTLFKKSIEWRQANGYQNKGGVIVFWNGTVQGWVNELRDPQSWQPGCFAVDEAGRQWIATGGNDYDGSEAWTSQFSCHKAAAYLKQGLDRSFTSVKAGDYLRRIIKSRPDYDYRQSASDLSWKLCDLVNQQLALCVAQCGGPGFTLAESRLRKLVRLHGKAVKRNIKVTNRALAFQAYQLRWYPR